MKTIPPVMLRTALLSALLILSGCESKTSMTQAERDALAAKLAAEVATTPSAVSTADTIGGYKLALANRIAQVNSTKMYIGRPQALLRSVVVVKYAVDANGNLLRSEILRSNKDKTTEATALSTLRGTAPFPKPAPALLKQGRVDLIETWLFNTDGRFQLRTIAEPQMNE